MGFKPMFVNLTNNPKTIAKKMHMTISEGGSNLSC